MAKYTQDQIDAHNDIKDAGTLAAVSRVASSYNAGNGERVVSSVQTDPVPVVALPASESMSQTFENSFMEEVKKGKGRFFLVGTKDLTFELEAGDLLYFQGKVWELAGATPLNPDGETNIIYTIGVRASALSAIPTVP